MSNNSDLRLNGLNPLAYVGVNPRTPVPFFSRAFDPTPTDYANFLLGTIWLNTTSEAIWMLVKKADQVSTWVMLSTGSSGTVTELTGDVGGPVLPVVGNINVITDVAAFNSGSTVSFSGSGNTLTLDVTDANDNTTIGNLAGGIMTGLRNTSVGAQSLAALTSGQFNTAIGSQAGTGLTTAQDNVLLGSRSGQNISTGSANTLIGYAAGTNYVSSESNNIILGPSKGTVSTSGEMWLGDFTNTTATYAAGIYGTTLSGTPKLVTVNSSGQLGATSGGSPVEIVPYTLVIHSQSPYAALSTDYYISCDVTAGVVSVLLPNAPATGRVFVVKDKVGLSATSNITITTVGGSVTIDGSTSFVMNTNYESANVIFNGSNYEVW